MRRDEQAAAIEELAAAIRALGDAIDDSDQENRVSQPSATDVLRVVDEMAIPALIAVLEAQIRTLRLLQRGSRVVRRGRAVDDRVRSSTQSTTDRGPDATAVLDRLGSTLDQVQRRLEGSADDETLTLLDRTRRLYDDIDRRIAEQAEGIDEREGGYRIDITSDSTSSDDAGPGTADGRTGGRGEESGHGDEMADVDVDAELETLREQYGTDDEADAGTDDEPSDSGDGTDAESDGPDTNDSHDGTQNDGDGRSETDGSARAENDTEDPTGSDSNSDDEDDTGLSDDTADTP